MCQVFVCGNMKWRPAIKPEWRSPRQGWVILTMPPFAPEQIRTAWKSKARKSNKNGIAALQEMVDFLRFNKIAVTNEMLKAMQEQADAEWCSAEPSRCPRTAGTALVRKVKERETGIVSKAVAKSQGFVTKVARKVRRCCGG